MARVPAKLAKKPPKPKRGLLDKLIDEVPVTDPAKWPGRTSEFDRMSAALFKAVHCAVHEATWDGSAVEDWHWDPYEQVFQFNVTSVMRMTPELLGRTAIIRSRFQIDPRKPLPHEVREVAELAKKYTDELLEMQRGHLERVREGARQLETAETAKHICQVCNHPRPATKRVCIERNNYENDKYAWVCDGHTGLEVVGDVAWRRP